MIEDGYDERHWEVLCHGDRIKELEAEVKWLKDFYQENTGKKDVETGWSQAMKLGQEVLRLKYNLRVIDDIEDVLQDHGCTIEDYTNPEKGITQLEAIIGAINSLSSRSCD